LQQQHHRHHFAIEFCYVVALHIAIVAIQMSRQAFLHAIIIFTDAITSPAYSSSS